MSMTVTQPSVKRPVRRTPVRIRISGALRSAADRIGSYAEGDPCPHQDGERLYRHPGQPRMLVCPDLGVAFPARGVR